MLIISLCFLLSSCGGGISPAIPSEFSFEVDGHTFEAVTEGERLIIRPASPTGSELIITENGAEYLLFGEKYTLSPLAYEKASVLYDALYAMKNTAYSYMKTEGNKHIYAYSLDGSEYLVYYNTDKGCVEAIDGKGIRFGITVKTNE